MPTGVQNVNFNGVDNSQFTIDRFWKIDASGYTAKPALMDLTFTYIDAEHSATGNAITENELGLQRWNSTINDWGDFLPAVNIDVVANTIKIPTVSAANLYRWWTMPAMNGAHALPVELASFKGDCNTGRVQLNWSTASEMNNDRFTVERSTDGARTWTAIKTVNGAGNSNKLIRYSYVDETPFATTYYRLKQTDFDNTSKYSNIIKVFCSGQEFSKDLELYPNPSSGFLAVRNAPEGASIAILNPIGDIVYTEKLRSSSTDLDLQSLSNGVYLVTVNTGKGISTNKLVIKK
jgi:hypothetical protein